MNNSRGPIQAAFGGGAGHGNATAGTNTLINEDPNKLKRHPKDDDQGCTGPDPATGEYPAACDVVVTGTPMAVLQLASATPGGYQDDGESGYDRQYDEELRICARLALTDGLRRRCRERALLRAQRRSVGREEPPEITERQVIGALGAGVILYFIGRTLLRFIVPLSNLVPVP